MKAKKYRDSDYLNHIADRIVRIERATHGVELAGFLGNEDLQAAIESQRHAQSEEEPDRGEDLGQ